ncbi:MAG: hypothetical protein BAJALOKI1v1_720005 [Promethearchaeota archaeon]|nr:MAG: hypothetical protein BAJALOKI1v1_720005 [Candidatus Lokiarchaeota archaeon]
MTISQLSRSAYPYITVFKKEPFESFVLINRKAIGSFFFSKYENITEFFEYFEKTLFETASLNLENIYWFLLLKKYLRKDLKKETKEKIYEFILQCEKSERDSTGFRISPYSAQKKGDIWSTYFALSSLHFINYLDVYLHSKGEGVNFAQLKKFIEYHDKGERFAHCLEQDCEICRKTPPSRNLYYVLEILVLLGIDVRMYQSKFSSYISKLKGNPSLVFKLLCIKYLDLEHKVEEDNLEFLHQFQKDDGGFSFKKEKGKVNTTFWISYTLEHYAWLLDYNPSGIYAYININLNRILMSKSLWDSTRLMKFSKLIILLSIIWKKFIEEIERVVFKEIEEAEYIDVKQLNSLFGLNEVIDEIISYINLNYTFNLKFLHNEVEFKNYLRNLSPREKVLAAELYERLSNKSIVSLTDIMERFNSKYPSTPMKIREFKSIIEGMINNHFFSGEIKEKRKLLIFTKYYFYLDFLLEEIIVSDTKINSDRIFEEKKILNELQNDIYNMTLKLRNIVSQIEEEIESYLLIDELEIARDRLKYIIRNALMEADFLNENIENSFNEELYYISIKATLFYEIEQWNKLYSILSKKLNEIDTKLKEKISNKEELRKYRIILEELENRLRNLENHFNRKIDEFRSFVSETLDEGYSEEKLNLILEEYNNLVGEVEKFDENVYRISQKITTKNKSLNEKHKKIISYWVSIKNELNQVFNYYSNGLDFFEQINNTLENIDADLNAELSTILKKSKQKVRENEFQEGFDLIKKESEVLIETKLDQIRQLQKQVKKESKSKQKLYLLFRHLKEKLEHSEEHIIEKVAEGIQELKLKVIEERNRIIIDKFDSFVSVGIADFRTKLSDYRKKLDRKSPSDLTIKKVINGFNAILAEFYAIDEKFNEKLNENKSLVDNFEEKSNLTIMQWRRFKEYLENEIKNLETEYINDIIHEKVLLLTNKSDTSYLSIKDIAKSITLNRKETVQRIKELLEISKINGALLEEDTILLIYTDNYYRNKELRNFINNKIIKYNNQTIGKLLALYDSCIKNRTLRINMEELNERITELKNFDELMEDRFENKLKELNIDIESKKEYKATKKYFENIISDSIQAIKTIEQNLSTFQSLQEFINKKYFQLEEKYISFVNKINKEIEGSGTYDTIKAKFEEEKEEYNSLLEEAEKEILETLQNTLQENENTEKLSPEIREHFTSKKNEFLNKYNEELKNINQNLLIKKNELFRNSLMEYITESKINLNHQLGKLQARIEYELEINEFKGAHSRLEKRRETIEKSITDINEQLNKLVKEYNKQTKDFETKNKHILVDFSKYIGEFKGVLCEKSKSLETEILKNFIQMAIKAVSKEYLTIGFIKKELKINKQQIQDHLLNLISSGELPGKYEPRFGIYYENEEVLKELDEDELKVMHSMNYKVYIFLNRLKNIMKFYYPIIAFLASFLTLSFYLLRVFNWNPWILIIPALIIAGILYLVIRKKKEEV